MRITKTHVEKLAAEIERRTGTNPVGTISSPGDGRTHYMMQESMTSTYYGARAAAAYLLGVLAGADPDGPVHWTETMPDWVRDIDAVFAYGQIGRAALAANTAGRAYGKTYRDRELLKGTRHEGDPNMTVSHGVIRDKRYDR